MLQADGIAREIGLFDVRRVPMAKRCLQRRDLSI